MHGAFPTRRADGAMVRGGVVGAVRIGCMVGEGAGGWEARLCAPYCTHGIELSECQYAGEGVARGAR